MNENEVMREQLARASNAAQQTLLLLAQITMELDKESTKIADIAGVLRLLRTMKDTSSEVEKASNNLHDHWSCNVVPEAMEEEGIAMLTFDDFRVEVRDQMRVNTPASNKEALHNWMREHGYSGMISEQINASSLKSMVKNAMQDGVEFPAHLLNIEAYRQATVVKR